MSKAEYQSNMLGREEGKDTTAEGLTGQKKRKDASPFGSANPPGFVPGIESDNTTGFMRPFTASAKVDSTPGDSIMGAGSRTANEVAHRVTAGHVYIDRAVPDAMDETQDANRSSLVEGHAIPKWGTTEPLTFEEIDVEIYDTTGRPLSEIEESSPGVLFQFIRGPKSGGRKEYEVNHSAFVEIAKVYPDVLGLISYVRAEIHPYDVEPTVEGMQSVLSAVEVLPRWLALSGRMRNDEIPPYITGASKTARGGLPPLNKDIARKFVEAGRSRNDSIPLNVPDFMNKILEDGYVLANEFDEDGRLIISPRQEACPAPEIMLKQFAGVLFEEPWDTADEVGKRLGLTNEDIQSVKLFGDAYFRSLEIVQHINDISNFSDKEDFAAAQAIFHCLTELNDAYLAMNISLGRRPPKPLTLYDILPSE